MAALLPKFSLHCDSERQKYTLRMKGSEWSGVFSTTDEALRHASTMVKAEAKLTVYNAAGRVLLFTTVFPTRTEF